MISREYQGPITPSGANTVRSAGRGTDGIETEWELLGWAPRAAYRTLLSFSRLPNKNAKRDFPQLGACFFSRRTAWLWEDFGDSYASCALFVDRGCPKPVSPHSCVFVVSSFSDP